jgi:hypothetical protein
MKINKILIVLVLAVALLGCGKREPRHIVILPDVSGSIDRESLQQAFKAIDELAGHLQRGDKLTIIPILGDAEVDASGKIMRFEVPANRQAYDTDLRGFRNKLNYSMKEMQADAIAHPAAKTDIFGSIGLGAQEFQTNVESQKVLLILSDFIQEDRELDFRTDKRLNSVSSGRNFAKTLMEKNNIQLPHITIFLGLLRGGEYVNLSATRRRAIQEFWIQYLESAGNHPNFTVDGVNALNLITN